MSGPQRARVELRRRLEDVKRTRRALARAESGLDTAVYNAMQHDELRDEIAEMVAARLTKGLDDGQ